jgi:hypothetical protein
MSDVEKWAKGIWAADRLRGRRQTLPDARLVIQSVTQNVVLCDAPTERFSAEMPTLPPPQGTEDWLPIDVLYGSYDQDARAIEIYTKNIERDASVFGAESSDLLELVRLHEYAHAVTHLGVRWHRVTDALKSRTADGSTDWKTFLEDRTQKFKCLDSDSHEFLAQAITFTSLAGLPDSDRSHRFLATFEALEVKQPPRYRVPPEIKTCATQVGWALLLDAARGDIDTFRGSDFSMSAGLVALARLFMPREHEWVAELDDEVAVSRLKSALSLASAVGRQHAEDQFEFLVDRLAGLRVEVFAREHPPPHFRVICGEESANYRIADCTQLNGGLRREYPVIRKWHEENRGRLIDAWNQRRPSDCPVGPYRAV